MGACYTLKTMVYKVNLNRKNTTDSCSLFHTRLLCTGSGKVTRWNSNGIPMRFLSVLNSESKFAGSLGCQSWSLQGMNARCYSVRHGYSTESGSWIKIRKKCLLGINISTVYTEGKIEILHFIDLSCLYLFSG